MSDTDTPLTETEARGLAAIAGAMIPADPGRGLPAANDPAILADMRATLGRDTAALRAALARAEAALGAAPETLEAAALESALVAFRRDDPAAARVFERVVARCYYRDDRVLTAIGVEPRPPFPKGYEVPQGDWSLLDPVRARGPIYRDA